MSNTNENKRRIMPITEERKRMFLDDYAEHGSFYHASAKASAHADPAHGAVSTFRMLRDRDPLFAAALEDARTRFMGKAEVEIANRAFTPGIRRTYDDKGNVRTEEISYRDANLMLLRLASKNDPAWVQNRRVEVDGRIEHTSGAGNEYRISAADVLNLDPDDRRAMFALLEKIESARVSNEGENRDGTRDLVEQPLELPPAQN